MQFFKKELTWRDYILSNDVMMLSKEEQFSQFLRNHKNKLLLTKDEINGDLFGSLLAWGFFLGRLDEKKYPAIYLPRYEELKRLYHFLPEYSLAISQISGVRDFILSFNTENNDIKDVRWRKESGHLDIIITPDRGSIDPRDFSFLPAKFSYDLLFALGVADFNSLGETYEKNSDLFFELPIVNLDNNPANESYAQLNLVDPMFNSIAELSADLMIRINSNAVKGEVAQCLLTALVEATDNFKNLKVTPKTFEIASFLMENGGDHQKIVNALYETESLYSLKLWGKMLQRLEEDGNFVWSYLTEEELACFDFPKIVVKRFFVRLKNYLDLGNRKLMLFWPEKTGNEESKMNYFLFKVERDREEERDLIKRLKGEFLNSEIALASENDFDKNNFIQSVEKIKNKIIQKND